MSKSVKHLIAAALIICGVTTVMPANNASELLMVGLTPVKAATYDGASKGELSMLKVCRSTGSELQLKSSYYGDDVKLSSKKDYYVELSRSEGIYMDAEVEGSGYVVKAFTSAAKDAEGHDVDDFIKIDSTTTNIYLRTYRSEDDYEDAYNDDNVTKCVKTYVIHVKKQAVEDSETEQDKDYPALKSIYLSDGKIDFSSNKMTYDVYVDEDVKEMVVKAKPLDDDYLVEIDGNSVDEEGDYESTIKLNDGDSTIKIKVESDDDDETYTLNIIRGKDKNTTVAGDISNMNLSESGLQSIGGTRNSWIKKNGKWQYIDGTGQPLKNKWWFDIKTGYSYYLDSEGNMKTGWINYNNKWYYANNSGEMQIGWVSDGGSWYYLNRGGVMITGWAKANDGNWYYFGTNGVMASNTIIEGYTIDSDGKWIK